MSFTACAAPQGTRGSTHIPAHLRLGPAWVLEGSLEARINVQPTSLTVLQT